MDTLQYFKNFASDRHVASLTPTSQISVKRICKKMDFDKARVIVEYGPGGGVFSEYILKKMHPDAKFVAIERNDEFCEKLTKKITDPRFILVNDLAENVEQILNDRGLEKADYILSGIPFSFFNESLKRSIIKSTKAALKPNGSFLVYQFYPLLYRKGKKLKNYLSEQLDLLSIHYELINLPPLCVYEALNSAQANGNANGSHNGNGSHLIK